MAYNMSQLNDTLKTMTLQRNDDMAIPVLFNKLEKRIVELENQQKTFQQTLENILKYDLCKKTYENLTQKMHFMEEIRIAQVKQQREIDCEIYQIITRDQKQMAREFSTEGGKLVKWDVIYAQNEMISQLQEDVIMLKSKFPNRDE